MRLRGYHIRGSGTISDMNLEFRDEDSRSLNTVYIFGKNGSGKTFILSSIAHAWSHSVLTGGSSELPYVADMLRIDYELGNEICGVHIRRGRLDKSSALAKRSDIGVGDNPHVNNGLVYYSSDRAGLSRSTVRGGMQISESVCNVFPIIYDLHHRNLRDSIILIDDWDKGLDEDSKKSFYSHLSRHALSRGNQLILSSSVVAPDWISSQSVVSLTGRVDPVQRAMTHLGQVDGSVG